MYSQVITHLREAYNQSAAERDKSDKTSWKLAERQHFLSLLQQEDKHTLLEIGAGTGQDSLFFQDHGLSVISTDLSPAMVERCQAKGLTAHVMDFLQLDFPAASFDAIYSLNSLLHVPSADLPQVLQIIQHLLTPTGLFYLGLYGGIDFEGTWPDDQQNPKRFFSYHTDEHMQRFVAASFSILSFKPIQIGNARDPQFHFQSFVLRHPALSSLQ